MEARLQLSFQKKDLITNSDQMTTYLDMYAGEALTEAFPSTPVGGISVGFYGADVRPVYWVSQWRRMTQGCGSHVASSRM